MCYLFGFPDALKYMHEITHEVKQYKKVCSILKADAEDAGSDDLPVWRRSAKAHPRTETTGTVISTI